MFAFVRDHPFSTGDASVDAYRAGRDTARQDPRLVAATLSNAGLAVLSGGVVNPAVDRFGDLFAALDARLASAGAPSRAIAVP